MDVDILVLISGLDFLGKNEGGRGLGHRFPFMKNELTKKLMIYFSEKAFAEF